LYNPFAQHIAATRASGIQGLEREMEIFGRYIGNGTWVINKKNGHVIIANNGGGEYQFQTETGERKSTRSVIEAFWLAHEIGRVEQFHH